MELPVIVKNMYKVSFGLYRAAEVQKLMRTTPLGKTTTLIKPTLASKTSEAMLAPLEF